MKNDIYFLSLQLHTRDIVKINEKIRLHRFVSMKFPPCYMIQLHENKVGYIGLLIRVFRWRLNSKISIMIKKINSILLFHICRTNASISNVIYFYRVWLLFLLNTATFCVYSIKEGKKSDANRFRVFYEFAKYLRCSY